MTYQGGLFRQYAVAEGLHYNWDAKESDLVNWWLRQSMNMDTLKTMDGVHLTVLDAGQRNQGPGPDIFRARIILDDIEMSGDVEMHSHARDWYRHGHESDAAYEQVILHVVGDGTGGPDLPTLQLDTQWLGAGRCLAQFPLSPASLLEQSFWRFKAKEQHLKLLQEQGQAYSPLLLGMMEVILAGAARQRQLESSSIGLALAHWPDNRPWKGSNLSFRQAYSKDWLVQRILENRALFQVKKWSSMRPSSWSSWDSACSELLKMGLPRNMCREWLVNILAPQQGEAWGFSLWRDLKIFRHYAMEKALLKRLGLAEIRTIAQQQGLLAWKNSYCSQDECCKCPLTQYHHSLTHIN